MKIEYKPLKDLVELVIDYRGKTPLKLGGEWSSSGYRALSALNVKTKEIVAEDKIRYVNEDLYKKWMKEEIIKGDILITSEAPFGQVFQWNSDEKIVLSQRLFALRIKNDYCSSYIFQYMASDLFYGELKARATGSTVEGLRQPALMKCKIAIPSLERQHRIASILSAYDNLIENNNRRIRLLEQMAENLYKEWFVRFRFPGHEKAEFENGVPKGWKSIRIKELSQLKSGYAFKSEWFVEEGESVAKIKDIGGTLMDTSDFSHVDRNNCIKAKRFLLVEGNLTIALTGATIGKISIVPRHDGNIYTNQRLGKFFMGDNPIENLPFLYCLFKQEAMVSTIINISNSSSAQPNISPEQIENLKIIGNKEAIAKFNEALKPMFSMILSIHSQNEQLTRQRDLLLPRLMSGKLEVKI